MAIVKTDKPETSGYTEDFWICYQRAREAGYNHIIAKGLCEYWYG